MSVPEPRTYDSSHKLTMLSDVFSDLCQCFADGGVGAEVAMVDAGIPFT